MNGVGTWRLQTLRLLAFRPERAAFSTARSGGTWCGRSACGAPLPANSAYWLFVAAGSPALGEEGFAPAGSIFAAGVLAFAAAVPAVAFSPLGTPAPAPPAPAPPAANNDET